MLEIRPLTEMDNLFVPEGVKPWRWEVIPRHSDHPLVGLGISDSEEKARRAVETIMDRYECRSAFGMLSGPGLVRSRCLRTRDGGFRWLPESRFRT